jgi:hypothetical protein
VWHGCVNGETGRERGAPHYRLRMEASRCDTANHADGALFHPECNVLPLNLISYHLRVPSQR